MEASNYNEDTRKTPSRSTMAGLETNIKWDIIEKEAEEMGFIPKRSSLARTPDKKRKNSSPSAIGICDEEDLDRSFREERVPTKNTKRYKTNKDHFAMDTTDTDQARTQEKEEARIGKSERERIDEIKNRKSTHYRSHQ